MEWVDAYCRGIVKSFSSSIYCQTTRQTFLQVRQLTHCLTAHNECLAYQVVKGEGGGHIEEEEEDEY